jgi:hypothetical protein
VPETWVVQQGLPDGEFLYELADAQTGDPVAVLDLPWPNNLQEGYSQPVAVLLNEGRDIEEATNRAGYRYFTDIEGFQDYVRRKILAVHDDSL